MSGRVSLGWNAARRMRVAVLAAAATIVAAGPALAIELPLDGITLGGFGTLGATYHNDRGLEFRRTIAQGGGTRAGEVSLATDSVFGLQLDVPAGPQLDVIAQGITQQRADRTWTPYASRAFVRYRPDESLMLRAGRIGYDVILLADSPNVGYSYLTIRPALEFFGLLPSDVLDGADATLTHPAVGGLVRLRGFVGRSPGEVASADGAVEQLDQVIRGGFLDYVRGSWTARLAAAYVTFDAPSGAGALADALLATGIPSAAPMAAALARRTIGVVPVQAGIEYDGSPWKLELLFTHVGSNSVVFGGSNGGLALAGYHRGALTPYVSFSGVEASGEVRPSGLPELAPFAPLDAAVSTLQMSGRTTQRTLSLGVRYDFARQMDLKLQVDRLWIHGSELIFDHDLPPNGRSTLAVIGLALDFVF